MRNLTKTLAVVSLLASANAYPLGIGDIKLHSALNQNLNAEIALVLSAGEKVSDIKVNLAPSDKFVESGVPWSPFLSKIKFESVVRPNGSVVIKLSSREALKEPFLGLLLEVSWPKGNLYREFTVLVDPPVAYEQATIPISANSESYEFEQDVMPERQPVSSRQAEPQSGFGGGTGYSRVGRNDTLWDIAERASRGSDVSIEQMMIAIYEQNPRAFYKENVNALLAGKKLKIPVREVAQKLSRKQALTEFNRQTKEWKNRSFSIPVETATVKEGAVDNQLTLVAPAEEVVTDNKVIAPGNEQVAETKTVDTTTVAPKTADSKAADTEQSSTGKEVTNGASSANDEIQSKVAELEKQLAMMQKILALKDQQLATLQNRSEAEAGVQDQATKVSPKENIDSVATKPLVKPTPVVRQPTAKPSVQPLVISESEASDSSLNLYYLIASGVGLGGFALVGWFWWRKRLNEEEVNAGNIFASSSRAKIPESGDILSSAILEDGAAYDVSAVGDNYFLSDFTPSDFDTFDIDQGEIDPVAEADVYLAYGRYQQAEELMRHAIKEQPGRDECKLKLLEIFYSSSNKQAFEIYAKELADTGKRDNAGFWEKVEEMGSEICQDSALFSIDVDGFYSNNNAFVENTPLNLAKNEEVKEQESNSTNINEMDFNLDYFEESFEDGTAQEASELSNISLDFDPSFFEEVVDEEKNNESIDFDFSSDTTVEKRNNEINSNFVRDIDDSYLDIDLSADKIPNLDDKFANDAFDGNFDFEFDIPVPGSTRQGLQTQREFGVSDLAEMDEMETKLDLAIAYIDMRDTNAAKDIAREVLEKGTAEQRTLAQALLDGLD
ncbi:MAG: FimV/HubP family polar landmark protein [Methylococcaceae bacterium]